MVMYNNVKSRKQQLVMFIYWPLSYVMLQFRFNDESVCLTANLHKNAFVRDQYTKRQASDNKM